MPVLAYQVHHLKGVDAERLAQARGLVGERNLEGVKVVAAILDHFRCPDRCDVELPMLGNILGSNRVHVEHAIAKVLASGRRRVGMIGLSFKTGTDDLRESPLVLIAEQFIGKGLNLLVYDPEVHLSRLLGANRRFIEQHVPHIGSLMREDIESVIGEADVLVVGLSDKKIFEALARHVREDQLVLDLVNIPRRETLRGKVMGLCW